MAGGECLLNFLPVKADIPVWSEMRVCKFRHVWPTYTGGQKELIMLRFMLLSAYIGRQEAHRTPTAFRVIVTNVLDRLRCVP